MGTIYGTSGNDNITGTDPSGDTIVGYDGNDTIRGANGPDLIYGNQGDDVLVGNGGNDVLVGGMGNDQLYGNQGDDYLLGNEGNDSLYGGFGNDTLVGGQGDDQMFGNEGNDVIYAGEGYDVIDGGADYDTLIFNGNSSNFVITPRSDGKTFFLDKTGAEGIKVVSNVEAYQWPDVSYPSSTFGVADRNLYCLGDSITEGFPWALPTYTGPGGPQPQEAWPYKLGGLRGNPAAAFNAGVSGNTSFQAGARFNSDTAYRSRVHIIELGRNDTQSDIYGTTRGPYSEAATLAEIDRIVNLVSHGRVLVCTVPLRSDEVIGATGDQATGRARVLSINSKLQAKYGLRCVDLNAFLIAASGSTTGAPTISSGVYFDVVHPSQSGATQIAGWLGGELNVRGW